MKCLITGGAGFIGSRLANVLAGQGDQVVLLDSLHPQVHPEPRYTGAKELIDLFAGDVADAATWDRLFKQHGLPDAVFHLAAETGTGQSLLEATRHGTVNVVGTTQMTDALSRHHHRPEHILLTSSRAVYGEGAWADQAGNRFYPAPRTATMLAQGVWNPSAPDGSTALPLPHDAATTWPRPVNVYAATKLAQEHLLEAWCSSFDVSLSILRLQNVFGPGQAIGNSYTGVLTFFARQLATGERLDVYEDGQIVRDFVFVDDVVSALVAALGRPTGSTRRLDIGSGRAVTLLEVAATMSRLASASAPLVSGRYRLGDVRAASADISKAAESLAWTPATSLDAGLDALLQWVISSL